MSDIFTVHEFETVVVCKVVSYSGKVSEFHVDKEPGDEVRVGGTASNEVIQLCCDVHSTFKKEGSNDTYAVITLKNQQHTCIVCGTVEQGRNAYVIETYDLNDQIRFIVVEKIPQHIRRHFINIDIIRDGHRIRRLKIDPYFGEGRII